jgi:hypothetical protein
VDAYFLTSFKLPWEVIQIHKFTERGRKVIIRKIIEKFFCGYS